MTAPSYFMCRKIVLIGVLCRNVGWAAVISEILPCVKPLFVFKECDLLAVNRKREWVLAALVYGLVVFILDFVNEKSILSFTEIRKRTHPLLYRGLIELHRRLV